ncbi:6030_t:CDS:2 [Funneliformis mosseae]|uniref:6030_t:CDS:1 n=1 Tax=Funneliformis mosseae TaxID=27381 RepID=A0A9N9BJJ1_FUNMO|nr:6030_t:CDS:2 [Funneliformis mosseae]
MDNVHNKHHLFEVYSSEEEIDDINELQDKYEYESVSNKEEYSLFGIETGDVFESWDLAEKQVQSFAKNTGFEVKKFQLEKNKEGVYHAQKKADIEDTCERKNENLVSNHHLSPEILEEIEFLINIGCGMGPIILALQKHFFEIVIYPKYVYNAICHIQNSQNKSKIDATETFKKLMKLQQNEFQKRWYKLLTSYLTAKKYLTRTLGQVVTSWALCYTSRLFNVGIQSTQRVEGYNSLIKRLVKSSATLFELDTHIQSLLNKEQQFERHEQLNQNLTVGLPNVVGRYFKRIDAIIKKFLTLRVLKMQHNQMNKSLLYRDDKVKNWKDLLENEIVEQDEDGEDGEEQQSDDEKQSDNKE